jgi:hypothetical protein
MQQHLQLKKYLIYNSTCNWKKIQLQPHLQLRSPTSQWKKFSITTPLATQKNISLATLFANEKKYVHPHLQLKKSQLHPDCNSKSSVATSEEIQLQPI